MPGPGERVRRVAAELRQGEHFAEKDFYLEEFRGRSVLVAVAPGVTDLGRLASALADRGGAGPPFPGLAPALATALRIPKLVLVDPEGGLLAGQPRRLSFVDADVLDTLLRQGQAEWSGLGDRRALLVAVREALHA